MEDGQDFYTSEMKLNFSIRLGWHMVPANSDAPAAASSPVEDQGTRWLLWLSTRRILVGWMKGENPGSDAAGWKPPESRDIPQAWQGCGGDGFGEDMQLPCHGFIDRWTCQRLFSAQDPQFFKGLNTDSRTWTLRSLDQVEESKH